MIVYLITNITEKHKPYVGILVNENKFKHYWGSGQYIKLAIKKHGKESFKKEILESGITDHKTLCEREKYWIKFYNSKDPNGYNLTDGGDGLLNPTKEVRQRMGLIHIGNKHHLGFKHSAEVRAKISAAIKICGKETPQGKKHYCFGKKQSEESNLKRRNTMLKLNFKHSKEAIDKIRAASIGRNVGRKASEETKAKISTGGFKRWQKIKESKYKLQEVIKET